MNSEFGFSDRFNHFDQPHCQTGPNMIYFEDVVLDKVTTAGPYLLTEAEIVEFSSRWDPFDFHTDEQAADASIFEGVAASGIHSVCIFNKLCHDKEMLAVRAVVEHQFRYPSSARSGDELVLKDTCVSTKTSNSRPDIGIVGGECQLVNQDGNVVLDVKSVVFVTRRASP